jgi:acyl-CoA dehydrogenase
VHKVTIARQILKGYSGSDGLWPSEHLPPRRAEARAKFAHLLDLEVGNL